MSEMDILKRALAHLRALEWSEQADPYDPHMGMVCSDCGAHQDGDEWVETPSIWRRQNPSHKDGCELAATLKSGEEYLVRLETTRKAIFDYFDGENNG